METKTLKELVPGSVVKIPGSKNFAMYMGAEYAHGSKTELFPCLRVWRSGVWDSLALPANAPDDVFELAASSESEKFHAPVLSACKTQSLPLPQMALCSGCDPEIFVIDSLGQVIPAWTFMPGKIEATARNLNPIWPYTPGFWDGFQAEFAPAAKNCLETLGDGIRGGLGYVLDCARKLNPKAKLTLQNSVELSESLVKECTDDQVRFRCTPSYNVYGGSESPLPDAREYRWRFAGGHIHIGLGRKITAPMYSSVVQGLDGILGIAGVSLAAGIDSSERRTMYGKAGEFRIPRHGIEYRVLSNFWLSHPAIYNLVFELMRRAVMFSMSGMYQAYWVANQTQVQEIIDSNDVASARKILAANKHILYCLFRDIWGNSPVTEMAIKTIMSGIGVVIDDPADIELNWDLKGEKWQVLGKHPGGNWASQSMLKYQKQSVLVAKDSPRSETTESPASVKPATETGLSL